jgi:NAD(P)H-dependent flavin oxidoreductase YrpB (nitropropane dioxygenase family)
MSGRDALPLVEGGKGIAVSNGESSGAWAATGGAGTFSGVNADTRDDEGNFLPQNYFGKTRRDRHDELIAHAVRGAIYQARVAYERSNGIGPIHMNILWEMGGAEEILHGTLQGSKGLIHGVTCGAGMPYKVAEITSSYGVYYYPIVSSARAFRALWKRSFHKHSEWLGGVVYEDPWRAGGHNGLSNSEDPEVPEDPRPRVMALRKLMNEVGLNDTPVIMAGGVWHLDEWADWIDDPEIAPVAFQFGTRPLLTEESPISTNWKKRLLTLKEGDVFLNRYSPTGFYSSAVRNDFIEELRERNERQVAFSPEPVGEQDSVYATGPRGRKVYVTKEDLERINTWTSAGFEEAMRTPDSTLIFVSPQKRHQIVKDQIECMGCLSGCRFSNWSEGESGTTGRKTDPRSYCIQKTLQEISHGTEPDTQLMFAGHNAFRFATDPYYANGYIPTVHDLVEQIKTGA